MSFPSSALGNFPSLQRPERRTATRYPLRPSLYCLVSVPGGERAAPAAVLNISTDGVGLFLGQPLGLKTDIGVELLDGPTVLRWKMLAHVVHVAEEPGGFLVGAEFEPSLLLSDLKPFAE